MKNPFDVGYEVYDNCSQAFGSVIGINGELYKVEFRDGTKRWVDELDLMYADTAECMLDICDCECCYCEGCYDELGDEVEVGY